MRKKAKALLVTVCAALLLFASVAGVLAYLTHTTETVTNTFTVGAILDGEDEFELLEYLAKDDDKDGVYELDKTANPVTSNSYKALPGVDLPKEAFVKTSKELELDAYVFIVVEADTEDTPFTVTVDSDNWTQMTGYTKDSKAVDLYVMKANDGIAKADSALGPVTILKDNKVVVANQAITAQLEVSFTGYMIQAAGFADAAAAAVGLGFVKTA